MNIITAILWAMVIIVSCLTIIIMPVYMCSLLFAHFFGPQYGYSIGGFIGLFILCSIMLGLFIKDRFI
jgi:hypothetical protein